MAGHLRIPLVEQGEHSECGLAACAMILKAYGRDSGLEDLRNAYGVPRGGLSIKNIVTILNDYGVTNRAVAVRNIDGFKKLDSPSILLWNHHHFVVLSHYAFGRFYIIDPASGRSSVREEDFRKHCSSAAVLTERAGGKRSIRGVWRDSNCMGVIKDFLVSSPVFVLSAIVLSLAIQSLGLIPPTGMRFIVNRRQLCTSEGFLLAAFAMMLVSFALYYLISMLNGLANARLRIGFGNFLFRKYMRGVFEREFAFFINRTSGDMIYRANLVAVVEQMLATGMIGSLVSFVFLAVYLVMMINYSPQLTMVTLAICFVILMVSTIYAAKSKKLVDKETAAQSAVQQSFIEIFSGIETVKSMNLEGFFYRRWSDLLQKQLHFQWKRGKLDAWMSSLSAALEFVLPLAIILCGSVLLVQDMVDLGTVVGFVTLASSFVVPFGSIMTSIGQFAAVLSYIRKIADIIPSGKRTNDGHMDYEMRHVDGEHAPLQRVLPSDSQSGKEITGIGENQENPSCYAAPHSERIDNYGRESLTAHNVSFSYTVFSKPVVEDITLHIPKGRKVAIVGPTGSGKSTVLKLLSGLIRPTQGRVMVDGHPCEELPLSWRAKNIAFVHQDTTVFNMTLRENILLRRTSVDESRLRQVCKDCCIDESMMNPGLGLDTMISEHGLNLSGGQRQKIAIARAMVTNPMFMVMDEPTSALDNVTENKIMRALMRAPYACVVVAHRLSSIRMFDEIYVMDDGHIVEHGSHESLMAEGKLYAKLYRQH